jgi:hypothetical protein
MDGAYPLCLVPFMLQLPRPWSCSRLYVSIPYTESRVTCEVYSAQAARAAEDMSMRRMPSPISMRRAKDATIRIRD